MRFFLESQYRISPGVKMRRRKRSPNLSIAAAMRGTSAISMPVPTIMIFEFQVSSRQPKKRLEALYVNTRPIWDSAPSGCDARLAKVVKKDYLGRLHHLFRLRRYAREVAEEESWLTIRSRL